MTLVPDTVAPSAQRQVWLDVLRIAAVLGVVAIHVFGGIVVAPDLRGNPGWWAAVIVDIGSVWVVPAFIMVSGALILTDREQAVGPAHFYRKRLLRLGPAFVFWQIFYIVVARMWLTGQDISFGGMLALVADGNTYTHLYFLWLIVGLYAVAPIVHAFLAQGGRPRALALAGVLLVLMIAAYTAASVLTYTGSPRSISLTAFTQWLPYVGFFVAGAALNGVVLRRSRAWGVAGLGILALTAIILEYGFTAPGGLTRALLPLGYPTLLTAITVLCLFLVLQALLARWTPSARMRRWLRTLSDASFGVFLIHFVLMLLLRAAVPALADAQMRSFWAAGVVWLVVTVASFAITIAARRIPVVRRVF